ncbi:hypothetical protein, partial [Gracilinema caldarium]|uniref:hypothetical protein n=1 Tax=Gracilinema caldarium TaxID=215591 RepID=UPI0026EC9948
MKPASFFRLFVLAAIATIGSVLMLISCSSPFDQLSSPINIEEETNLSRAVVNLAITSVSP